MPCTERCQTRWGGLGEDFTLNVSVVDTAIPWRSWVGYALLLLLLFSTLTGLGPYRAFLGLGLIYVIHASVTGHYPLRQIPRSHLLLTLTLALFWLVNQFYPEEIINQRAVKNIAYAAVLAATVNALPPFTSFTDGGKKRIVAVLVMVVAAAVVGHLTAIFSEEGLLTNYQKFYHRSPMFDGLFDNIHFLGLFCCCSLPLLWLGWVWFHGWPARVGIAVIVGLDFLLLFASSSRPAWLTVAVVLMSGLVLLVSAKRAMLTIFIVGGAAWGLIQSNLLGVTDRVTSFTSRLMDEERVTLWTEAAAAIMDSSFIELLLGRGIGSYAYLSPSFSTEKLSHLVFPHNFILEWLFETGMVGCLVLMSGLGYVLLRALRPQIDNTAAAHTRILIGLSLGAILLHGFFVLPFFYSRQILFLTTLLICLVLNLSARAPSRVG